MSSPLRFLCSKAFTTEWTEASVGLLIFLYLL